jgi:hypothetical protein
MCLEATFESLPDGRDYPYERFEKGIAVCGPCWNDRRSEIIDDYRENGGWW